MHHDRVGQPFSELVDCLLPAAGGPVVDEPEHPFRGSVRPSGHDPLDEGGERGDAGVIRRRPNTFARCTSKAATYARHRLFKIGYYSI